MQASLAGVSDHSTDIEVAINAAMQDKEKPNHFILNAQIKNTGREPMLLSRIDCWFADTSTANLPSDKSCGQVEIHRLKKIFSLQQRFTLFPLRFDPSDSLNSQDEDIEIGLISKGIVGENAQENESETLILELHMPPKQSKLYSFDKSLLFQQAPHN